MQGIRAYRLRALCLPLAILTYVAVALLARPANNVELYPFFNWNLFSDAKSPMLRAEIEVRAIDGVRLPEPLSFYHMADVFADSASRDTRLAKVAKRLANAIMANDIETRDAMRRIIETVHLREAGSADYDVVVVKFDPIERYLTGRILDRTVLASYSK